MTSIATRQDLNAALAGLVPGGVGLVLRLGVVWTQLALAIAAGVACADTAVPITGIGTRVGAVATHVDFVTYSDPVIVDVPDAGAAWEVHGTVYGVGWGGTGILPRARNARYSYQITWLGRWPLRGGGKTLVVYHHGGAPSALALAQTDLQQGAANVNRFAEQLGDDVAGAPTLVENATYIASNRRGMVPGGRFAATYLSADVPPFSEEEAALVRVQIAPNDPSYSHPDIQAEAPVPCSIAVDTATARDVDRALGRVMAEISGRKFRERISIGTSAGAVVTSGMAFGCSAIGTTCLRTGGNHWIPYDTTSERIYDGFLFSGFVYDSAVPRVDAQQPLAAPVFILQGRGDERYQQPIHLAYELLQKGVILDGSLWIYEIANMPHITRDTPLTVPPVGRNGEALGPYFGAAIRNMRALIAGAAPPASRIAGRLVDGKLVFDVEGGTDNQMPVLEDPAPGHDTADYGNQVTLRRVDEGIYTGNTGWWTAVTAALPHENDAIVGPSLGCRIGWYTLRFTGTGLTAFTAADLAGLYGSFAGYRDCVTEVVDQLAAADLYDPRVETAMQTADRARDLFAE